MFAEEFDTRLTIVTQYCTQLRLCSFSVLPPPEIFKSEYEPDLTDTNEDTTY